MFQGRSAHQESCMSHMMYCLPSTCSSIAPSPSGGSVIVANSNSSSPRPGVNATGRTHLHARTYTASRWQCQAVERQALKVYASTKGFGRKPEPQNTKKSSSENTVKKPSESAQQSRPVQRPPQLQQTQQDDDKPEEVPEIVNDRMLKRIIAFCGIPVFTGFLLFPLFYYLKVTQHVDLPMSVVYIVQLLTFGGGFFGITYGILSASWDPRREGSLLGITEFKANLPLILDRVKSRGGKGRV